MAASVLCILAAAPFAASADAHYSTSREAVTAHGPADRHREKCINAHFRQWHRPPGSRQISRVAMACCLFAVLAEFAVVVMRYGLAVGSIRLQESVTYAHAALFIVERRLDVANRRPRARRHFLHAGAAARPGAGGFGRNADLSASVCGLTLCGYAAFLMWGGHGPFWSVPARRAACRSFMCSRPSFRSLPFKVGLQGIARAIRAILER